MIDTGQTTDVGRQRDINQDQAGVAELGDQLLLLVADGMGGHVAGEQAARIVIESLFDRFEEEMDADPRENLYFGVQEAHRRVMRYGDEHDTVGMGSTAVAACIVGDDIFVAHVGDSRFYQFRDGKIAYRTKDHTKVQIMLELGAITAEEAEHHPEGNIITRAVGHERMDGKLRPFEADVIAEPLKLQAGDTLLLCSDGLYDLVSDEEILRVCAGRPAQVGCDALVELANERGGHDNITVVILHCAGGTAPPMPGAEFDKTPEIEPGSLDLFLGPYGADDDDDDDEDDYPPNRAPVIVAFLLLLTVLGAITLLARSCRSEPGAAMAEPPAAPVVRTTPTLMEATTPTPVSISRRSPTSMPAGPAPDDDDSATRSASVGDDDSGDDGSGDDDSASAPSR